MSRLSRRSFLAGASSLPLVTWLASCAGRAPETESYGYGGGDGGDDGDVVAGRVRYDARSPQGQQMLAIYRDAVGRMQTAIAEGSPQSWVFQWYTHNVRGDRTKAGELQRIYPSGGADRDLADEMWNTCQAHHPGDVEDYFLPWHRMYVYFFEQIVRQVSGRPEFTLPYWNYSTSDMAIRGVIPPEFGTAGSALFVDKRNPGVNAGQPIQGTNQSALSLAALGECKYSPTGNLVAGFNQALDFGLHGNIHVLTGNGQNMGSVPWAAGDPVFWAHHCQIDRLWASWNRAGRQNPIDPSWLDHTFVFADANGQKIVARIGDFNDIANLGSPYESYAYDAYETVPACPPETTESAAIPTETAVATGISLASRPIRVALADPAGRESVAAVPAGRRVHLVVRDLSTNLQPGVVYNVFVELPEGAATESSAPQLVGTINFFGAMPHGDAAHGAHESAAPERFTSFDVTDIVSRLGGLSASPTVTIAPVGTPAAEASPVVGRVSLAVW